MKQHGAKSVIIDNFQTSNTKTKSNDNDNENEKTGESANIYKDYIDMVCYGYMHLCKDNVVNLIWCTRGNQPVLFTFNIFCFRMCIWVYWKIKMMKRTKR